MEESSDVSALELLEWKALLHINASFFSEASRSPAGDFGVVSAVSAVFALILSDMSFSFK